MINRILLILIMLLIANTSQAAVKLPSCKINNVTHLGFFNGVGNIKKDALDSLDATVDELGKNNIESLDYDLYYNETKGAEDFIEVFDQKFKEEFPSAGERFELLSQLQNGGALSEQLRASSSMFSEFQQKMRERLAKKWVESLSSMMNISTSGIYEEHITKLDDAIKKDRNLLFVAHSQGNLFVNKAYEYARTKVGRDRIGVIHVAPASFKLSGNHILADWDLVIAAVLGSLGPIHKITDNIGPPEDRRPGYDGKTDVLGHGYLAIYLNSGLTTYSHFIKEVKSISEKFNNRNCSNDHNGVIVSALHPMDFTSMCDPYTCTNSNGIFKGFNDEISSILLKKLNTLNNECEQKTKRRTILGAFNAKAGLYTMSCFDVFGEKINEVNIPFSIIDPTIRKPLKMIQPKSASTSKRIK